MRPLSLFLLLTVLANACSEPGTQVVDGVGVAGVYTVNGTDPEGVEYSGTVTIVGDGDSIYRIEWVITGGIHEGTGVVTGDRLDVEWRTTSDPSGQLAGSGSYVIEPDGDLVGTRELPTGGSATEHIFQSG